MIKQVVMALAFILVGNHAVAASKVLVSGMRAQEIESLYQLAYRNGGRLLTVHDLDRGVVMQVSAKDARSQALIIRVLKRSNSSLQVETQNGRLDRMIHAAKMKSFQFDKTTSAGLEYLHINYARASFARHAYSLTKYDREVRRFLSAASQPSSTTVQRATAIHAAAVDKLKAYPDGDDGLTYVHCSQLGICWCGGYDSCNILISACAETDSNWHCIEYDSQGGCIDGVCSI